MIKTSVIVPVYNTQAYLEECFDSIFAQTQKEIEVIAVNDGSTDDSLSVLEKIKERYPELQIINQKNQGPGQARNTGMKLAKGEYIYFCDSDDFLCNCNALERCYQYAAKNGLDVVMFDAEICGDLYGGKKNFYDRKDIIETPYEPMSGEAFIINNFRKAFCPSPDLIYIRAEFLSEQDIYFKKNVYYEDNLFYGMIMLHAKRVMYLPERYYGRRYRQDSIMTSVFDKRHLQDALVVFEAMNELECGGEIKKIYQEIAVDNMKALLELAMQNNLFEDKDNAKKIYEVARTVCGRESYRESDILYQSARIYGKEDRDLENIRNDNLKMLLSKLMFDSGDAVIGIYGIGKEAQRLFREYEKVFGSIKAKLIYIMSNPENRVFRNQKVIGISEIAEQEPEYILITSASYEQEMEKTVTGLYGDQFKLVKLCGDLRF